MNIFMVELLCELRENPECAVNSVHSFVFLFGKKYCIKTTSLIFEGDSWFVYSPRKRAFLYTMLKLFHVVIILKT